MGTANAEISTMNATKPITPSQRYLFGVVRKEVCTTCVSIMWYTRYRQDHLTRQVKHNSCAFCVPGLRMGHTYLRYLK